MFFNSLRGEEIGANLKLDISVILCVTSEFTTWKNNHKTKKVFHEIGFNFMGWIFGRLIKPKFPIKVFVAFRMSVCYLFHDSVINFNEKRNSCKTKPIQKN
jgi:hypothetical protein